MWETSTRWHDLEFRAMGTDVRLVWSGLGPELGSYLQGVVADLETRWTRFDPASELMALNARAGGPVRVSAPTFDVIARAVAGWRATGGRFDPTGRRSLEAWGYRASFEHGPAAADQARVAPLPGCGGIELDWIVESVDLPVGVELDLGGIGKGRAADIVAARALAMGAHGICADLGGDLRCEGSGPYDGAWEVAFADAGAAERFGRLRLTRGAVATSTIARRAWTTADGTPVHHLLEPSTGHPIATGTERVTVIAGEAWFAEVATKAAMVAGPGADRTVLADLGVAGAGFATTGEVWTTDSFTDWCRADAAVPVGSPA